MARNKRTSLKDIANKLGVSTTLVSIVVNGKARQFRISEKIEKEVLSLAKEMNYSQNLAAKSLREGKSQLLGVIITDMSNPFYATISRIIENRANELNFTVLFSSSDENLSNTQRLVNVLLNKGVDGLIIVPCDGSKEILENLEKENVPLVLLDRHFPETNISYSVLNNYRSTTLATQHLLDQGYSNISVIGYKTDMSHIKDRIAGYEDTMRNAGLGNKINIQRINISNSEKEIKGALSNLLKNGKSDAVICLTNLLTVNGIYYLNEINIKIPNDIAVVGFNKNDVFNLYSPRITYIKQPMEQIAREAIDILIDKIQNGKNAAKLFSVAEPELVIQNSSCRNTIK